MKKKFKYLVAAALASVCTVCVTVASATVGADSGWETVEIQESYLIGSDFTVPTRNFNVGGKDVAATATLVYPNGTATKATNISLSQAGLYQIKYTALNGGDAYADTLSFKVEDKAFGATSKNSSVSYERVQREFPACYKNAEFDKTGVMVRLEKGDTLTVAELIDVGELTKEDVLIGLTAIPDEIGKCDFERFELVLTDSLDSSVQLRISVNGYPNEGLIYPFSYVRAGGENQPRKGYEASKNKIHVENNWGAGVTHSFYGIYNSSVVESWGAGYNEVEKHQIIKLRYDAENVALYGTERNFIIDMDDPNYFDDLWHGFPSGKAKLSISAASYSGVSANFLISEIYGVDLTANTFYDTEKPVIEVDTEYKTMPTAKVGTAYSVPKASVFDYYSGALQTDVEVYYNYNSENPVSVGYQNGAFTPSKAGYYAIVYTATDYYGNAAQELLWVKAGETVVPSLTLAQSEGTAELGTLVELPAYTVSGGSGNATVKITATNGTQTVDCSNGYFRPETQGVWTVTYTATDYIGQQGTATYTLTTSLGAKPLFLDEAALPKAFVSGSTYIMPVLFANDYTSGTLVKTQATATVFDGEHPDGVAVAGGQAFTPKVTNSGDKVTVKYQVGASEKVYEIPAILPYENNKLNVKNYFVGTGFTLDASKEGTVVTASAANGGFTFANALLAQNLAVQFTTLTDASNYAGLKITLTDADAPSVSVTAYIQNKQGYSLFTVGETTTKVMKGFTFAEADNTFAFGYRNGELYMASSSIQVKETTDGTAFDGFVRDKVWLQVEFIGADAASGAAFRVSDINGQPITTASTDRIAPSMQVYGTAYGGSYACGNTVKIPYVYASDVLDPNITFTLTVTTPDGKKMTATDGTVLDKADPTKAYELALTQLGNYRVSYEACDTFEERKATFVYQIVSQDTVSPKLSYSFAWKTTAKVGETYLFPVITTWDDYAGTTLLITVFDPEGGAHRLKSTTNALQFANAGVYKIHVMATDASGNVTSESILVTVSE